MLRRCLSKWLCLKIRCPRPHLTLCRSLDCTQGGTYPSPSLGHTPMMFLSFLDCIYICLYIYILCISCACSIISFLDSQFLIPCWKIVACPLATAAGKSCRHFTIYLFIKMPIFWPLPAENGIWISYYANLRGCFLLILSLFFSFSPQFSPCHPLSSAPSPPQTPPQNLGKGRWHQVSLRLDTKCGALLLWPRPPHTYQQVRVKGTKIREAFCGCGTHLYSK